MLPFSEIAAQLARSWKQGRSGVQVDTASTEQLIPTTPDSASDVPSLYPAKNSPDRISEVAMAIAEHVTSLNCASQPIAIDVPLMLAGLNPTAVVQLHAWLQDRYDWEDERRILFDEDVTAEGLAKDIFRGSDEGEEIIWDPPTCIFDAATGGTKGVSGQSGEHLLNRASPGSFPTSAHSESLSSGEGKTDRSPSKAPLSVQLFPDLDEVSLRSAPVPTHHTTLGTEMASYASWTGRRTRKTGMVYGLLALGLLGSPSSPLLRSPSLGSQPASVHTPVFSPWLETVRFLSMEPVQSPWIPNRPRRGSDGLWAFPQSPRGSRC